MVIRWSKIILVFSISFYVTLVVFNNLTDYYSNYYFVQHVLSMDTTFVGNKGMWRSLPFSFFHHLAYLLIILVEGLMAFFTFLGGYRLYKVRNSVYEFNNSKGVAISGLILGVLLWFVGFMAIGGEWFLMWQSEKWNGQQA
ncbi:DUF2165 family protein, partial [Xanthovirga aplysinae]|uniref:DUF2165 family protein n=1 Tax=Xanthovirga aplysinae TaxID=2529853 RepID=UPI0012BD13AF